MEGQVTIEKKEIVWKGRQFAQQGRWMAREKVEVRDKP